jgi:Tfp pilus assembly protein PilF
LIATALEFYGRDNVAALTAIRRALVLVSAHAAAWRVAGYVATESAFVAFRRAVAIDPTDAASWNDAATAAGPAKATEAAQALRRALALQPAVSLYWHNVANISSRTGMSGVASLRRTTAIEPFAPETWLALTREILARREAGAIMCARRTVALAPGRIDALLEQGHAVQTGEGWCAARSHFRWATAANPLSAAAWHNRAAAALTAGSFDEGDRALRRALAIAPALSHALLLFGNRAVEEGDLAAARRRYERTHAVAADFSEASLNLGMLDLLDGDCRRGWSGFATRWGCVSHAAFRPTPASRPWDGRPDQNARLVLRAEPEQALGDTLQFARFVPEAAARVGEIVLECEASLHRLLARLPGITRLIPIGGNPGSVTHACGLMDLGAIFAPSLGSLSDGMPYLSADSGAVETWRERLAAMPYPRMGLCWRGNPRFRMDRWRSPGLTPLEPVLRRGSERLVSLIYNRQEILPAGMHDPMPDVADMADTAALISALDLVITSDTAIAHLAGGLGVPTWVLLHEPADWRWLRYRADSPWYRSVRLFRQPRPGDWTAAVMQLDAALADFIGVRRDKP